MIVLIRTRKNRWYYLICENYLKKKLEFSQSITIVRVTSILVGNEGTWLTNYLPVREVGKTLSTGLRNEGVWTRLNFFGETGQLRFLACESNGSIEQKIEEGKRDQPKYYGPNYARS